MGSPNSSIVHILPVRKNFARAGRQSTFGVVIIATPVGARRFLTLRRKPIGLSTCSMTSMAVMRSNEPGPSWQARRYLCTRVAANIAPTKWVGGFLLAAKDCV